MKISGVRVTNDRLSLDNTELRLSYAKLSNFAYYTKLGNKPNIHKTPTMHGKVIPPDVEFSLGFSILSDVITIPAKSGKEAVTFNY